MIFGCEGVFLCNSTREHSCLLFKTHKCMMVEKKGHHLSLNFPFFHNCISTNTHNLTHLFLNTGCHYIYMEMYFLVSGSDSVYSGYLQGRNLVSIICFKHSVENIFHPWVNSYINFTFNVLCYCSMANLAGTIIVYEI